MFTLASLASVNGVVAGFTYGLIPNNPYTWDYNRIFGCACDVGWTGYDCSQRICPLGDDPDTTGQFDGVQQLSCIDTAGLGSLVLTFRGQSTPILSGSINAAYLTAALEALSTVGIVSIEPLGQGGVDMLCTPEGNNFLVTFKTQHGDLPLLTYKTQNIDTFSVTTLIVGTKVKFTSYSINCFISFISNYHSIISKEMVSCSNKGLCDAATGLCSCFAGFGSSDGMGNRGNMNDCGWVMPQIM